MKNSIFETIKHNAFRYTKFSLVGIIVFIAIEFAIYTLSPYPLIYILLGANLIGVLISYTLNRLITMYGIVTHKMSFPYFIFNSIWSFALGVSITYGITVGFSISPLLANFFAGFFTSPILYYMQITMVWKEKVIY